MSAQPTIDNIHETWSLGNSTMIGNAIISTISGIKAAKILIMYENLVSSLTTNVCPITIERLMTILYTKSGLYSGNY